MSSVGGARKRETERDCSMAESPELCMVRDPKPEETDRAEVLARGGPPVRAAATMSAAAKNALEKK
jgi:hypothetical protein